jgi:aminoglycoside 3-N-acetyltransferase
VAIETLKHTVNVALASVQARLRSRAHKRDARHFTRADLARDFATLGLVAGDTVFVHSSLKSIGYVEGGPRVVFDALRDVVGSQGTVIVPTYYLPGGTIYATCKMPGYEFDPRIHGTNLGALPAAFLTFDGISRSIHPTHSVSAQGKHAVYITRDHHTAPSIFGAGSPWDRCIELNGKVLGIGVTMGPVTFYHVLEDRMGASFPLPVRLQEQCLMPCRDWQGNRVNVPVVPLDPIYMQRRIDNPSRKDLQDYFWSEFDKVGLLKTGKVGAATSWYIPSREFYEHLAAMMRQGLTIYSTPEELANSVRV